MMHFFFLEKVPNFEHCSREVKACLEELVVKECDCTEQRMIWDCDLCLRILLLNVQIDCI